MTDKNNTKTVRVKEKIKAIYPHIVVGGKIDKPCFSIHWYDVKKKEMYIGYSSYNLNYVREWLKENFEIVEPEIDNLINRQKAEIERLGKRISGQKHALFKQQAYTAELQNEIVKLKDYNENLLAANTILSNEVLESKAKAEAEAYKEFAQKAAIELTNAYSSEYARWIDDTLNNLLEKLIGDNK